MTLQNTKMTASWITAIFIACISSVRAADRPFPGVKEEKKWVGGSTLYRAPGNRTIVAVPPKVAEGKPWVWRARFWGHESQFDKSMIDKGYHVVYCDVSNLYGAPQAVERWNEFYNYLRKEHGFSEKAVLEGMSRGGLIIYNWAAANPEKVAAIYGDAPVMDFKSWPGYKNAGILRAYGFKSPDEAQAYSKNPVDNLAPLAKARIPIIHVVGDLDDVVPVAENTAIAERRYKELGGVFEVIHKKDVGHHPHSLKDPTPIVDFIQKHTTDKTTK
jgi:pimeloyl-ACP methyl ester carboxylesterase